MNLPKRCNRCGAEIKLLDSMPRTPHITYFSGNAGASEEIFYLCPICRRDFVEWFKSYNIAEWFKRHRLTEENEDDEQGY